MVRILKTDQENPSEADVIEGARVIREGGLVVFPTETVYGLGADAFSSEACLRIYEVKKRPADNPLIVHISRVSMLNEVAQGVSDELMRRLEMVWPGPVTILFRKKDTLPDVVTGGTGLVAVRMPANRLALMLIDRSGTPIAAPSANISTRPSITDSRHAIQELKDTVDLIYDSGPTQFGLESTIIDVSGKTPELLRAGSRTVEDLEGIFGKINVSDFSRGLRESTVPLAPGMKYRHYSPRKKMFLASSRDIASVISRDPGYAGKVAIIGSRELCLEASLRCLPLGKETDLEEIGHNLFSAFRELEDLPESVGVIMPFPETGQGLAIMNRIRKASYGFIETSEIPIQTVERDLHPGREQEGDH